MEANDKKRNLAAIAKRVNACRDCALHKGTTQGVPGEGDADAGIMFVGEGPGFYEDKQGRPFVGAAGKFLDQLLASIGLDRKKVFITNIVKHRPPNNRDPQPDEIEACSKYLEEQIEVIEPKVIVTLGRHSMQRYFPGESISRVHGQPRRKDGQIVVPMYHPAAALHQQSLRNVIEADFRKLPEFLEKTMRGDLPAEGNVRIPAHLRANNTNGTPVDDASTPEGAGTPADAESQQMRLL
jgi:uracil-DNA glycosylase